MHISLDVKRMFIELPRNRVLILLIVNISLFYFLPKISVREYSSVKCCVEYVVNEE
jgi:hypothetical protein